jgi:hypothetical protein
VLIDSTTNQSVLLNQTKQHSQTERESKSLDGRKRKRGNGAKE